ncbi:MAG: metal-dependent hydrolase [Magnetococcales bacterium]|nr:metal-dependent hydrolase [Magnetococcales bacterium]
MDIVTQGIIGALAAQAIADEKNSRRATLIGFIAGLPADADILIASQSDPLLTLDFHRQFTHSLFFIPIGGLLVAALLWLVFKNRMAFSQLFRYSLAGYATSGLLDACTSYGTQLLWPFSNQRIAWSIISVFDPIFSITLIVMLVLGWRKITPRFSQVGWLFVVGYFLFGINQQANATNVMNTLAVQRGHAVERSVVKPTMGNLLLWRAVYQSGDIYYITAVRVSPLSPPLYYAGDSIELFDFDKDLDKWPKDSTLVKDVHRFHHFSDGYIAKHPEKHNIVGDVRYSLLPFDSRPIWGITLRDDKPDSHVPFKNDRSQISQAMKIFPSMIAGTWDKFNKL